MPDIEMENEIRKPTKKQILKALKADMTAADTLRLEAVTSIETWRDEYHGRPYGNEQKGKSAIVSRDIKRQDEWQHASVKDPFVADEDIIKCGPVTHEDRLAAQQNELVLNHQFVRQFPRYKFMTDVIKLYYAEGTVVVKCAWKYEDEEVEVEMPIYGVDEFGMPMITGTKMVKQLKVTVNQPDATICRIEDIYMDPTAEGDLAKAQFIIHRYESDMSTLRKAKKYKNLDAVSRASTDPDNTADYDAEDDTEFKFTDDPRKKLLVHEYWGNFDIEGTGIAVPMVCTWVEDVIIQLESNPYPDQEIPFLVVANNSIPFKLYGEANAELIGDNQKVNTAIKRGILDNMANSNNAQKGMRVGSMDPLNKRRFLNGKNFEYNGSKADFFEGSYNQIPGSVFNVMEMTNNETESMLGVKAFTNTGIAGSSMGSTAKAAGGVLDAVAVRRSDIVRNIAENLIKPLMRKWTSYNSEFLRPEETIRITNEDFVEVKRDDLKGMIDIKIKVSTAEDNANKAQELSFLLQTLGQTMDQGMRNLIMSEIARLNKMPDLAKAMANYEPQPDPVVEKIKELEVKKLESEILERMSRTEENKGQIVLNAANTRLADARARQLDSGTDLDDLDFTRKADGTEHREKMQEKAFDHGSAVALKKEDQKKPLTKQ